MQRVIHGELIVWTDDYAKEFVIWDFNPIRVKNAGVVLSSLEGSVYSQEQGAQIKRKIIERSIIDSPPHFKAKIYSGLACLETRYPFVVDAPSFTMRLDAEHLIIERFEDLNVRL
jgi:hypothetical protein